MLVTSRNVLLPGNNYLLTTSTDDPSLAGTRAIIKMSGHQHWWLAGGYNLEIEYVRSGLHGGYLVDSGFLCSVQYSSLCL